MTTTAVPTGTGPSERTFYHPAQDDWATILETAAESGGRRTLLEVVVAPGGGNELHRHLTYAERFTVLSGTLTVRAGRETVRLTPGGSAVAPVGTPHCFRNETPEPATFHVELTPGHRGFEQALQIGYGLAVDGQVTAKGFPKDPRVLGLLLELGGMGLCGPARAIAPLTRVLAARARRAGLDARLVERYVRV